MTQRILVADRIAQPGLALLEATGKFELIHIASDSHDTLLEALANADALLVRSQTKVTADLLKTAPRLRFIARAGTGVDTIDVDAATRLGIAVLNTPAANTVSAAEHTMALLLSLARHIPEAVASMREGAWDRKRFEGSELRGKALGVIGLGRIGMQVVRMARGFAMQVRGYDPYLAPERAERMGVQMQSLDTLLQESDVVTLHVPRTEQTVGLIGARELRLMKPGALLVNAARGELVDDQALVAALESGHLGGAALDVFAEEPLPSDHPLRSAPRAIVTPHLAASTAEAQERVATEICAQLRDALLHGDISGAINVPGVERNALVRLTPALDLARRLGALAVALMEGNIEKIEVGYGGKDESAPRPVQLAAVEGLLASISTAPVSLINAQLLAEERGFELSRRVGTAQSGFETTVGVKLRGGGHRVDVRGALAGGTHGRVIAIDGFEVDVAPEGWMLIMRNRDVPGVIGRVGTTLGRAGLNIGTYHQSRSWVGSSKERVALAVVAVDGPVGETVLDELRTDADVVSIHLAHLGDGQNR